MVVDSIFYIQIVVRFFVDHRIK